ncbi:MAG: transaldolase family protein, partial [Rhabdochlamydiaceae bacterium]
PGPVVVDVYSDFLEIGAMIAALSPRIILRIPAIESAWESIHLLSNVMVGAIFSPVHAMLAARAGALYVCPNLSRMVKTGEKPFEQIESVQKIISNYQFPTQVMVLHPKSLEQVKACAEIGVSGCILRDDLYKELLESHELAAFHTEQSIEEWKKSVVLFSSTH